MLQFPGFPVSVQQSSSERPIGHKFFFSANRFVKIRNTDVGEISAACDISSLVARRSCARKSTQVSYFLHLLMFSTFLAFGLRLGWRVLHKNECPTGNCTTVHCLLTTNFTQSTVNFCCVFATWNFNLDVRSLIFNRHSTRGACRRHV